jgi:hypothetical protein
MLIYSVNNDQLSRLEDEQMKLMLRKRGVTSEAKEAYFNPWWKIHIKQSPCF